MCIGVYSEYGSSLPLSILGEPTPWDEREAARQNKFVESKRVKAMLKESRLKSDPVAVRRLMRALAGWGGKR